MSAFKQGMRKLGVRAGVLAGASAAVLAVSGLSAGSAMAGGPPTCPGGTIAGQGSTLQKNAQLNTWTGKYHTHCLNSTVTYTGTGSGAGLAALGFKGGAIETNWQFIGTDEAPTETQINASNATSGAEAVIVPVTQTAIAVLVNMPANCQFKSGKGITWSELGAVFGGNGITEWSGFSQVEAKVAGACNVKIKRIVRKDGSGTSYQFKNYLSTLEGGTFGGPALPCTTEGHTKWGELRANELAGGAPNTTWPECVGGTTVIKAEGGGGVVSEVVATPSSIGYAALPDAKGKAGTVIVPLQNGLQGTLLRFASAENTGSSIARCESARYTLPPGAATGLNVDWSETFGASPNIGSTEYPLCTLTFDVGFHGYETAGYTAAQGEEVADYINNYVIPTGEGQKDLKEAKAWYSPLPENVQIAAEDAAEQLE